MKNGIYAQNVTTSNDGAPTTEIADVCSSNLQICSIPVYCFHLVCKKYEWNIESGHWTAIYGKKATLLQLCFQPLMFTFRMYFSVHTLVATRALLAMVC